MVVSNSVLLEPEPVGAEILCVEPEPIFFTRSRGKMARLRNTTWDKADILTWSQGLGEHSSLWSFQSAFRQPKQERSW